MMLACSTFVVWFMWLLPYVDQLANHMSLVYSMNHSVEVKSIKSKLMRSNTMPYHLVYTSRRSDWKVLANLTAGALSTRVFYNPCYASETTKVASKRKMRLPPIPARRPLFSSMHFTHPEHVDVARELCHFKKGFQLSNTTRKLISNNLADVISSQLLCDAVTVCDMNPLDEVIDLLVVIFSRPFRTHQRKLVRKYWGRDDCYAGRNVRHVFLTGVPAQSNAGEVKKLLSEAEQERDLVVQDFADSNNFAEMYKMLLGLRWSLAYCKSAKLVLFTSDEIFLVPENVVGFIESVSDDVREHLVAGKFVARGRVERRKGKPEYVPKTEYAIAEWPDSVSPH
ncbi:unnamed protein product, partial [Protopolystoma xenopodis]